MVDSKKIVIVGIPGVGKSSLVKRVAELIRQKNKSVSVRSYGTEMLEEAKKIGVKDRDELRTLPVEKQKELAVQDAMLSSCSVLSGSPMKVIFNHEGKIEEAADSVLNAIGL